MHISDGSERVEVVWIVVSAEVTEMQKTSRNKNQVTFLHLEYLKL